MKRFSPLTRYAWAFLAAALFLIEPRVAAAQLTTLRVGTNSPASTEAMLFSIAKDAGILKQHQLDAEVI
jgi:ABC-type nitrate/sulfonate/bicarbonate transport system substrate-binding protein